eukprot:6214182-Pleurochrysis_carterae.AAC.2
MSVHVYWYSRYVRCYLLIPDHDAFAGPRRDTRTHAIARRPHSRLPPRVLAPKGDTRARLLVSSRRHIGTELRKEQCLLQWRFAAKRACRTMVIGRRQYSSSAAPLAAGLAGSYRLQVLRLLCTYVERLLTVAMRQPDH